MPDEPPNRLAHASCAVVVVVVVIGIGLPVRTVRRRRRGRPATGPSHDRPAGRWTDMTFVIHALDPAVAERARSGTDDLGGTTERFAAGGGEPLRCCLRDADPGEELLLMGHRPVPVGSPYAESGPVFVHADACAGYADPHAYPAGFRARRQLLRSYDARGHQVDNRLVDGPDADAVLEELLARPDVVLVHSRNPMAGCFMFAVTAGDVGTAA